MDSHAVDTPADLTAAGLVAQARPHWTGVRTAREAVGLARRTVLHSGPPVKHAHELVNPTLNSAAVAAVFEGWAETLDEGLEQARSGAIHFEPAQDCAVLTPMAAVVSPSMALIEMTNLDATGNQAYAPINGGGTGGGAGPRYGKRTPDNLKLLDFLNGPVADRLRLACREPLAWLPLTDQALCDGDDLHLCHDAAHARLLAHLGERLGPGFGDGAPDTFMGESPFFHLNFSMAALGCAVFAGRDIADSSVVTAFGGNGTHFGLQLSGLPGRWFTCAATPPRGRLREPNTPDDCVGAYGDSAIVEAFGLGALAHSYCPRMREMHAAFYEADLLALPAKLLTVTHPELPRSMARTALSARRVVAMDTTPVVELGIVERTGDVGGLGAGLYRPPLAPFAAALEALASTGAR